MESVPAFLSLILSISGINKHVLEYLKHFSDIYWAYRSISTSIEYQKHENTTPAVNLSTTESQYLSEPKLELLCSYSKKGK